MIYDDVGDDGDDDEDGGRGRTNVTILRRMFCSSLWRCWDKEWTSKASSVYESRTFQGALEKSREYGEKVWLSIFNPFKIINQK